MTTLPAGWMLAPVDPTIDMLSAADNAGSILGPRALRIYVAMLAAAPTPPAIAQDAPITVSLDTDPRGISVGVWQGSRCIYTGAHAVPVGAQDDAKDERTRVMEIIAGVWDRATQIDDAADEVIDLLRAPAAGDALDAARYRWLRQDRKIEPGVPFIAVQSNALSFSRWVGGSVDAAIDAAIAQQSQRKEA